MTNTQFKEQLQEKLAALRKMDFQERPANYKEQEDLLTSALKIMTYGTGEERRRFRRDYERRMGV